MNKRLQLEVVCQQKKLLDAACAYVFTHEINCQKFDQVGETRLFKKCDQKRDQAKSKALEMYFQTFCGKSNTRNFNLDF